MDFELKLGASISGRVTDAATGLPIAGVELDANSRDEGGPGFNGHAHSDADGRYTFQGLAPGAYGIRASAERQGYVRELYDDSFDWEAADLVAIIGTEAVQGVDISLALGATISGQGGRRRDRSADTRYGGQCRTGQWRPPLLGHHRYRRGTIR